MGPIGIQFAICKVRDDPVKKIITIGDLEIGYSRLLIDNNNPKALLLHLGDCVYYFIGYNNLTFRADWIESFHATYAYYDMISQECGPRYGISY